MDIGLDLLSPITPRNWVVYLHEHGMATSYFSTEMDFELDSLFKWFILHQAPCV